MTKAELYQKACMLPLLPGVYIIRDKSDTIIYIGKAKRLRIRVSQYFREGVPHDNKVSQMIAHAYAFDVIVCQSEFEALVLEASQIKAHTPKYNILLKDDKGYSYIRVTREDWPRLSFTLQKEEDGAEYIGPYTSSFAARQMAETAMDAFRLPRCNKRFPQDIGKGRPCLNAHIGKCMAVCSGKISCENYNQAVKNAVHLIRYGKKDILKTLNERMLEASDRLEFETAALIRDQINAITKVSAGQKVVVDPDVEMDVVALAGTPGSVCAAVLRFREGRLTDKREFLFHDTSDIDAVREEFLPRYYLDDEQIPKIIAVDALPPDVDALQQALNQKRGSEVQRFGVKHKEKLKENFIGVDMLTLSATPIPRTLNMAMSGIRDLSTIEQPPIERQPVETFVLEYNDVILAEAMKKELARGGQVYYLHNRVDNIESTAAHVSQLVPGARVGIAHGKMTEEELNPVWQHLLNGEIDILVCTTLDLGQSFSYRINLYNISTTCKKLVRYILQLLPCYLWFLKQSTSAAYSRLGQLCERLAAAGGGAGLRLAAGRAGVRCGRPCACVAQKAPEEVTS